MFDPYKDQAVLTLVGQKLVPGDGLEPPQGFHPRIQSALTYH